MNSRICFPSEVLLLMFDLKIFLLKINLNENYQLVITSTFLATLASFLYNLIAKNACSDIKIIKAVLKLIYRHNKYPLFLDKLSNELITFYNQPITNTGRKMLLRLKTCFSSFYLFYKFFARVEDVLLFLIIANILNVFVIIICPSVVNYITLYFLLFVFFLVYLSYYLVFSLPRAIFYGEIDRIFEAAICKFKNDCDNKELNDLISKTQLAQGKKSQSQS